MMEMDISYITWNTGHRRWCVICPNLPEDEQNERASWCASLRMDFTNIGVRFWFAEEKDVMLFRLKWA